MLRFKIPILASAGCFIIIWLLAEKIPGSRPLGNRDSANDQRPKRIHFSRGESRGSVPSTESMVITEFSTTPGRDVGISTEELPDFTGVPYFAKLREAVLMRDPARINNAFEKLAVHLEEHPGNLPGVMAAMKSEQSPEMDSCLARLVAAQR